MVISSMYAMIYCRKWIVLVMSENLKPGDNCVSVSKIGSIW